MRLKRRRDPHLIVVVPVRLVRGSLRHSIVLDPLIKVSPSLPEERGTQGKRELWGVAAGGRRVAAERYPLPSAAVGLGRRLTVALDVRPALAAPAQSEEVEVRGFGQTQEPGRRLSSITVQLRESTGAAVPYKGHWFLYSAAGALALGGTTVVAPVVANLERSPLAEAAESRV